MRTYIFNKVGNETSAKKAPLPCMSSPNLHAKRTKDALIKKVEGKKFGRRSFYVSVSEDRLKCAISTATQQFFFFFSNDFCDGMSHAGTLTAMACCQIFAQVMREEKEKKAGTKEENRFFCCHSVSLNLFFNRPEVDFFLMCLKISFPFPSTFIVMGIH